MNSKTNPRIDFKTTKTPSNNSLKLIEFETCYIKPNPPLFFFLSTKYATVPQHGAFSLDTMLEGPWLHITAFPTPMVWPLDESQGSSPLRGYGSWLMCEVALTFHSIDVESETEPKSDSEGTTCTHLTGCLKSLSVVDERRVILSFYPSRHIGTSAIHNECICGIHLDHGGELYGIQKKTHHLTRYET